MSFFLEDRWKFHQAVTGPLTSTWEALWINPLISSLRQHTKAALFNQKTQAYRLSLTSATGKSYHQRNFSSVTSDSPQSLICSLSKHALSVIPLVRELDRSTGEHGQEERIPSKEPTPYCGISPGQMEFGKLSFLKNHFPNSSWIHNLETAWSTILSPFKLEVDSFLSPCAVKKNRNSTD